jgi:uncharacterized protein YjbJ (UPF0337 family)
MEKGSQTLKKCGCEKNCDYDKESGMKSSIRDVTEGAFHELKGTVKEIAGKLSDNPKLQVAGTAEKIAGKFQEKVGQVKKVLGK